MASTESLGLMLFTIEIMKARLTSSGLSFFTLAFTNCRRMPCIASRSGTPNASAMSRSPSSGSGWSMQNPCDKSFTRGAAAALVRPVAAIAVALLRSGTVFTSISPRARIGSTRFGNAQAIIRRGEPVQLQFFGRMFCLQSHRSARCRAGSWAFCKLRDDGIVPLICPTCQNVFVGFAQSIHASDHHATLHGVVFDILVESQSRVGLAAVFPVDDRRLACRAVAREPRARLRPEPSAPVRPRFRFAQATPDTLRPDGLRLAGPRVARQGAAWWGKKF